MHQRGSFFSLTVLDLTVASVKPDPFDSCGSGSSKARVEQKRVRLQLRLCVSLSRGPLMTPPTTRAFMPIDISGQIMNVWSFWTDSPVIFSVFPSAPTALGSREELLSRFCSRRLWCLCLGCGGLLEIQVWTRRTKDTTLHHLSLKGTQTVNVFTRGCGQTAARGEFNARLQTCDRVFNFRVLVLLQQQICARLAHSSPVQGNRVLSCRTTFTHERV